MNYNNLCPNCMREIQPERSTVCPYCGCIVENGPELTHQLRPFTILDGKYLVGNVLGEGGCGITYIGCDLNLEIRIAVKEFYPNGFCRRESAVTNMVSAYGGSHAEAYEKWKGKFVREAKSLAKCSHLPGIVGVKDFFEENNTAYIVMEYLEGETLKEYIDRQGGKLPVPQILEAMEPIMAALAQVHMTGLIHRDISPDNIMITTGGAMKLLDFGAAVDFMKGEEKSLSIMLKPGYAPEEQYRTKGKQGPWSDVYALAATIYKCITGITPPEAMERLRTDGLVAPREMGIVMAPSAEAALLKGMSVYANDRYQTMEEFHRALTVRTKTEKTIRPRMPVETVSIHEHKRGNGYGGAVGIAAGAAVLLIVFLILTVWAVGQGEQQESAALPVTEGVEDTSEDAVKEEEGEAPLETSGQESAEMQKTETAEEESVTYRYEFLVDDVTWYEAYEDCVARGGHLVTIESSEEFEILTEQLMDQDMERYIFWMGGMRLAESRDYHWVDAEGNPGELLLNGEGAGEYQDYWLEGEPSYQSGETQERFMMLFYKQDQGRWVWNDATDDLLSEAPFYEGRIAYICELGS